MARRGPPPPPPEPAPIRPPLTPSRSSEFKRDVKRLKKQGKDMSRLLAVIGALCARQDLEARHRDHPLVGNWLGSRECHVEGDWLLIYQVDGDTLALLRSGTHSELFRK